MATTKAKPRPVQAAIRADCVSGVGKLHDPVQLVLADPPYNVDAKYDSYKDLMTYDSYCAWTRQWMQAARNALDPTGSLVVFVPDEWASEVDLMARKSLGMTRRRWIIWAFTFGQKAQKNFTRSHCHILWFSKHKTEYTFNLDAVKVPSARQLVYQDKRAVAGGKPPDDTWMLLKDQLEPHMGADKDAWLVSRVCGTYKERKRHSPNQIPVPITDRLVGALTNPRDRVVDMFCGTGGSGVSCKTLGRDWVGFDLSKTCVTESNRRIAEA